MRKYYANIWVLIVIISVMIGCTNSSTEKIASDFSIEIQDSKGDKYNLTKSDIYYQFYKSAQESGVLTSSWNSSFDIRSEFLTNFFVNRTNWIHTDAENIILPEELVEQYIQRYFDVDTHHLKKSAYYKQNLQGYELPLMGADSSSILKVVAESNTLTIYYETYYYSPEKKEDDIAKKGFVVVNIISYPNIFQYISNEVTYDVFA